MLLQASSCVYTAKVCHVPKTSESLRTKREVLIQQMQLKCEQKINEMLIAEAAESFKV